MRGAVQLPYEVGAAEVVILRALVTLVNRLLGKVRLVMPTRPTRRDADQYVPDYQIVLGDFVKEIDVTATSVAGGKYTAVVMHKTAGAQSRTSR